MQPIIIEKPYTFVPPYTSTIWSSLFLKTGVHRYFLRRSEGVIEHEIRELDHLRQSVDAGHSILLTPNHPRTADPLAMGYLAEALPCHLYAMASWHLFNQEWLTRWAIRRMGGFSVNREGVDRQSISTAVDLLAEGKRPLVIFPEGATGRTNDSLRAMLDGVAFIARAAAKKAQKQSTNKKVVIHPVAIKYRFQGDIQKVADQVLSDIEKRLTWRPHSELPILTRIAKVGLALLALKEQEFLGDVQTGSLAERLDRLINHLLHPIESEWLSAPQFGSVVPRVRNIRVKILPEMVQGQVAPEERKRRWRQLEDIYLAQQLSCYPPDYLASYPSVDRVLETLERFEEDLTDKCRLHGQLKVILQVAPAIEVSPERSKGMPSDPLMQQIQVALESRLSKLALESPRIPMAEAR